MGTFEGPNVKLPHPVFQSLESWAIYVGNDLGFRPGPGLLMPILDELAKNPNFSEHHIRKSARGRFVDKAGFLEIFTLYVAKQKELPESERIGNNRVGALSAQDRILRLETCLERLTEEVLKESGGADEKS